MDTKFFGCLCIAAVGIICLLNTTTVLADSIANSPSLGGMAQSILVPVDIMTGLMYKICYILGGAMIVGSGVQYKAHRDNPLQVPINRPILLLLIGLVLVALPFIAQLSSASRAATGS